MARELVLRAWGPELGQNAEWYLVCPWTPRGLALADVAEIRWIDQNSWRCPFTGKVAFISEDLAVRRMNEIRRARRTRVVPCRAIQCEKCRGWELTSLREGTYRRKRDEHSG